MLRATTHLLTSEMIIFIDTDMLFCLWSTIQFFNPVSRLGHFAIHVHIILLTSEMIIFIEKDIPLCLWPVMLFFSPASRLGHFVICVHYYSPTFVILFPIHIQCSQLQVDIILSSCPITMLFHILYHL